MFAEPGADRTPVAWNSRGIGLDVVPGCFVCGAERRNAEANDYLHNICAHIKKENEAAALACFTQGARMGYYHADRQAPQIKVGACDAHLDVLKMLSDQWYISAYHVSNLVNVARYRDAHPR